MKNNIKKATFFTTILAFMLLSSCDDNLQFQFKDDFIVKVDLKADANKRAISQLMVIDLDDYIESNIVDLVKITDVKVTMTEYDGTILPIHTYSVQYSNPANNPNYSNASLLGAIATFLSSFDVLFSRQGEIVKGVETSLELNEDINLSDLSKNGNIELWIMALLKEGNTFDKDVSFDVEVSVDAITSSE